MSSSIDYPINAPTNTNNTNEELVESKKEPAHVAESQPVLDESNEKAPWNIQLQHQLDHYSEAIKLVVDPLKENAFEQFMSQKTIMKTKQPPSESPLKPTFGDKLKNPFQKSGADSKQESDKTVTPLFDSKKIEIEKYLKFRFAVNVLRMQYDSLVAKKLSEKLPNPQDATKKTEMKHVMESQPELMSLISSISSTADNPSLIFETIAAISNTERSMSESCLSVPATERSMSEISLSMSTTAHEETMLSYTMQQAFKQVYDKYLATNAEFYLNLGYLSVQARRNIEKQNVMYLKYCNAKDIKQDFENQQLNCHPDHIKPSDLFNIYDFERIANDLVYIITRKHYELINKQSHSYHPFNTSPSLSSTSRGVQSSILLSSTNDGEADKLFGTYRPSGFYDIDETEVSDAMDETQKLSLIWKDEMYYKQTKCLAELLIIKLEYKPKSPHFNSANMDLLQDHLNTLENFVLDIMASTSPYPDEYIWKVLYKANKRLLEILNLPDSEGVLDDNIHKKLIEAMGMYTLLPSVTATPVTLNT